YGDKSTVWMLYGISVLMFPLFFIIPKIDPKGKSYEKIDGFYSVFRLVMVVFLIGMLELVIFSAENAHRFNIGKIAMIALSLLMIFMGNYLPKCKHNYTMGIKTMWTYADERVWNDTHRFGGMLFFVSGIISLVATLLLSEILYFVIGIGTVLITIVVTTVYSYFSYKKYNG
ncbi:MAG: SdpI family protein, partial [Oscillospiraceae bacterium]|nr:SdpI family protein [Oscillospiraceae bacterium]